MRTLAPCRDGPDLLAGRRRRRRELVHVGDLEAVADNANRSAIAAGVSTGADTLSEPGFPRAIAGHGQTDDRQARGPVDCGRVAPLGRNVVVAHVLPLPTERTAVEQPQTGAGLRRLGHCTLQAGSVKAHVAVDGAVPSRGRIKVPINAVMRVRPRLGVSGLGRTGWPKAMPN